MADEGRRADAARGTRLRVAIVVIASLLATAAVAGCGGGDEDRETTDSRVIPDSRDLGLIERDTLIVGSDIPYSPFEEGDPPEYEGFDIDLINAVASKLGLETEIEDTTFDLVLEGGRGQFDLSISAVKITPARERRVDFSRPYFIPSQGLLVREDSDIQSLDDITSTTIVGAEGGTDSASALKKSDASEIRAFPSADDAVNALLDAQVDAVIAEGQTIEEASETREGLEIAELFPTDEEYGIVVPQDNGALLKAVNAALLEVKDDGTLDELYEEYFGLEAPEELRTQTNDPT